MIGAISHITDDQSTALQRKVSQIAEETNAEMIVCFGLRTLHGFVWSSFLQVSVEMRSLECDLVILTREKEKRKRDRLSDSVMKHNNASFKFTVLVHGIEAISDELKEGHYFFASLFQRGEILFDSQKFCPRAPQLIPPTVAQVTACWTRKYDLAHRFFQGATYALQQGWNDHAVFMLHQAVEHACTALIKAYLGYRASSHNLSRLLSIVENFSFHNVTVFPRITPGEVRLFTVLEKAYSDSRYNEQYSVSTETADALKVEVEAFMETARALFDRKVRTENRCREERGVSPFESIGLDTFANVIVRQGEQEAVEIDSMYGSCKNILVKNEGKRLWITTANLAADAVYEATVCITYKHLSAIVVHHAESLICKDPIAAEWFAVINNSAAQIALNVKAGTLDVTSNKHGRIILSGFAGEGKILNNRSGEISAKELHLKALTVLIKGSGNVAVHVENELHATLHGTGNLMLTGSPRVKTLVTKGTGTLKIHQEN